MRRVRGVRIVCSGGYARDRRSPDPDGTYHYRTTMVRATRWYRFTMLVRRLRVRIALRIAPWLRALL